MTAMELSLMERFADPVLFEELSRSELIQGALITTMMGMGTTFVVLILLWGVIALVSSVIKKTENKGAAQPQAAVQPPAQASVTAPAVTEPVTTAIGTGSELVAVITAAIAAMEGTASANNLIIRKISRISGNSTAWSRAGSSEVIDSRKF